MSGIFEELEMFDEGDKVATRQAIAVANKRFNDKFAGFLRQASSKKEFEGRLALVDTDINNMVADVANEYGGDAEKIATAVKKSYEFLIPEGPQRDPWEIAVNNIIESYGTQGESPENARYHLEQAKDSIMSQVEDPYDVGSIVRAIEKLYGLSHFLTTAANESIPCENCGDHGCEHCTGDPEAAKTAKEDRPEHLKAQDEIQKADEHSQVPPWLKKQDEDEDQEDGGNLRNKEAAGESLYGDVFDHPSELFPRKYENMSSQPFASPVPLAERPGYTAGGGDIDAALEQAPSAVGKGKEAAAHKVEEKDNKFYVTEKGEGEVAGPFDSQEDAHARANELNDLENLETEETHSEKESSVTAAMAKALELKHANDNWVNKGDTVTEDGETKKVEDIEQEGDEKVVKLDDGSTEDIDSVKVAADVETGDKTEERESLPKGDEDALGGPSPKIDKKKWVPNATNPDGNLEPIDTEGEHSPVPTRQMDIKQKPDYQNDDPWENDNKVWEREQLPSSDDNAGFDGTRNIDQPTKAAETFPDKGQTNPVTREALSAMDRTASFRVFLNDIGMSHADFRNASDEQKSRLWDIYNNYDMPKYTEEEGLNVPLTEEAPEGMEEAPLDAPVEDIFADDTPVEVEEEIGLNGEIDELPIEEEVIIEETPEDVESIIEREDDEGDRVTVVDEGDEDIDLNVDEDLEEFAEIDPSEFSEGPSEEELEDLIRNIEENPDDFQ
jgi:hypothetical protein